MKLLDKSQELGFFFFFVLLGPTRRVTLCCFCWCSAAPQSSCSGIFWMAWKRSSEIISKIAGFILCLEDSVQVITRWFWRNFAAFFPAVSVFSSLCGFFFFIYMKVADCVSDFDLGDPWMLCKIPTVIKQYLLVDIQMSHVSKEFIQWHTQLKENIVLYRNI